MMEEFVGLDYTLHENDSRGAPHPENAASILLTLLCWHTPFLDCTS